MPDIDWKQPYNEPEEYGVYLVSIRGQKFASLAHFNHPNDCRETGWYIPINEAEDEWEKIDILYWAERPLAKQPNVKS